MYTVRTRQLIICIVSVVVFVCVTGFFFGNDIMSLIGRLNLLPAHEPLTELYFEDPNSLPTDAAAGETVRFRFTVHNLEYKALQYRYTVSAVTASDSSRIDYGTFILPHDGYKTVRELVVPATGSARIRYKVDLQPGIQSIHLWLTVHSIPL